MLTVLTDNIIDQNHFANIIRTSLSNSSKRFIHPSIHPSIHPIHPSIHSSIHLSIHPFIHQLFHLSIYTGDFTTSLSSSQLCIDGDYNVIEALHLQAVIHLQQGNHQMCAQVLETALSRNFEVICI